MAFANPAIFNTNINSKTFLIPLRVNILAPSIYYKATEGKIEFFGDQKDLATLAKQINDTKSLMPFFKNSTYMKVEHLFYSTATIKDLDAFLDIARKTNCHRPLKRTSWCERHYTYYEPPQCIFSPETMAILEKSVFIDTNSEEMENLLARDYNPCAGYSNTSLEVFIYQYLISETRTYKFDLHLNLNFVVDALIENPIEL